MIPLARPSLSWHERRNVAKAVKSTWIGSKGLFIDRATEDFKQVCGTENVALVSNGTTALHLALLSLNVQDGDEVIIPNFTYVAVANAVRYCNARPIFCNVDSQSWNLDPAEIRIKISPKTKAIIVVNSYGRIADYPKIRTILSEMRRNDIKIIEDASQSHFGSKNGFVSGTFGDIATFSFFANKVLTTGEGGAVCSNDKNLIDRVNFLKNQSLKSSNENYFDFPEIGYNYRMNNLAAALLCGQIKRSGDLISARNEIYQSYRQELEKYEFYEFQTAYENEFISPWLFPLILKVKDFQTRNLCIDFLRKNGVETRPFYKILSMLPAFQKYNANPNETSNKLSSLGINLPTYVGLRQKDIKGICRKLNRFMQDEIITNYVS